MSLQALEGVMLDQINTADSDSDVACRWLRANEEIWKTWFPARGSCSIHFGMYSATWIFSSSVQKHDKNTIRIIKEVKHDQNNLSE